MAARWRESRRKREREIGRVKERWKEKEREGEVRKGETAGDAAKGEKDRGLRCEDGWWSRTVVTGTHTSTWFYCFGSLAAPRLSTPFPALSESHHPADGHPSPSHEVAHPLIRPSTPFGQTSTHRSRKPAPCSPALSLSRSLSPSHPPSFRSFHLRPRSTTLDPTHPRPRPFKLARIPRMHQLFLIVCLTRTHATATAGIRARITHTHTLSLPPSLSFSYTRSRADTYAHVCGHSSARLQARARVRA